MQHRDWIERAETVSKLGLTVPENPENPDNPEVFCPNGITENR